MKVPPFSKKHNTRSSTKVNQEVVRSSKQKSKVSGTNENVCAACLFQIQASAQDYCSTQCKHHYHQKCLQQWLKQKNTCCLCRQVIKTFMSKTKGEVTVPDRPERPNRFNLLSLLFPMESFESNNSFPQIIFFDNSTNPFLFVNSQISRYFYHQIEGSSDAPQNRIIYRTQRRPNLTINSIQIPSQQIQEQPPRQQINIREEINQPQPTVRQNRQKRPKRNSIKRKTTTRPQKKNRTINRLTTRKTNRRNVTRENKSIRTLKDNNIKNSKSRSKP